MAGPPTFAFSQLTLIYQGSALPHGAATTHGFTAPTADAGDVEDAVVDAVDSLRGNLANSVTVTEARLKFGPESTGPTIVYGLLIDGGRAGAACPPNVCGLVRLTAEGVSGRFAGRFFLPGMVEDQVTEAGNLMSVYRSDLQTNVTGFYEALLGVGMVPKVFSAGSSDPRDVSEIRVQQQIASQRKRNRR